MFICGTGSFSHHDDYENEAYNSPCPTPKRSKRSTSFCKILGKDYNANKNPYADRGLDKFYALLADLDDKKQKIYTQMGSEDISFVQFVYTNDSNRVKPIVVKVKEKKGDKGASPKNLSKQATMKDPAPVDAPDKGRGVVEEVESVDKRPKRKRSFIRCSACFKLDDLRRPHYYFPVVVVLILLFLAIYGKSFAILCTSIGWYLAPTIVGGTSSSSTSSLSSERKPKRKKEYVRRQSEKTINVHSEGPSSPTSVLNGLTDNKSQPLRRSL